MCVGTHAQSASLELARKPEAAEHGRAWRVFGRQVTGEETGRGRMWP